MGRNTKGEIAPVIVLILVVISGVLGWVIGAWCSGGQSDKYLPPVDGVLDYYVSVNEKGNPLPYTPYGEAYTRCETERCKALTDRQFDLSVFENLGAGYLMVKLTGGAVEKASKLGNVSLFNEAYAGPNCPIIGYIPIGGVEIVPVYPKGHPDCPP